MLFDLRVQTLGLMQKAGETEGKSPADPAFPGSCPRAAWVGGSVRVLAALIPQFRQGWGWRRLGVLMASLLGMILPPSGLDLCQATPPCPGWG